MWFQIPDLNNSAVIFYNQNILFNKNIENIVNPIEVKAFALELNDNFKNFSALNFLKAMDNGNITDRDLNRFFYMCYLDDIYQKEKMKLAKEVENKRGR